MCACGCFLLIAIAAGLAWAIMHQLWWAVLAIVVFCGFVGWFGRKTSMARKLHLNAGRDENTRT